MQAIEVIQKQLRRIAAETNGQQENVRTFMGRQLLFFHKNAQLPLLPYIKSDDIQIQDATSPNFGKFYSMVDIDTVDGNSIIQ